MKHHQPALDPEYRDILKGANRREEANWEELCRQLEEEKNFFKEQYEKLYQSYCQKRQKLKEYKQYKKYIKELEDKVRVLEHKVAEYEGQGVGKGTVRSSSASSSLKRKHELLTQNLILKNEELEEVYEKLQDQLDKGSSPFRYHQIGAPIDVIKQQILSNTARNFDELKSQSIQTIVQGLNRGNVHMPHPPLQAGSPHPLFGISQSQNQQVVGAQVTPHQFTPQQLAMIAGRIPQQLQIPQQLHVLSHHNQSNSPSKTTTQPFTQTIPQFTTLPAPILTPPQAPQPTSDNILSALNQQPPEIEVTPPSKAVEFCPITLIQK